MKKSKKQIIIFNQYFFPAIKAGGPIKSLKLLTDLLKHKFNITVLTSSFQQVRKKIYKNSSEEWKKYKNFLKPMIEILSKNNIKF